MAAHCRRGEISDSWKMKSKSNDLIICKAIAKKSLDVGPRTSDTMLSRNIASPSAKDVTTSERENNSNSAVGSYTVYPSSDHRTQTRPVSESGIKARVDEALLGNTAMSSSFSSYNRLTVVPSSLKPLSTKKLCGDYSYGSLCTSLLDDRLTSIRLRGLLPDQAINDFLNQLISVKTQQECRELLNGCSSVLFDDDCLLRVPGPLYHANPEKHPAAELRKLSYRVIGPGEAKLHSGSKNRIRKRRSMIFNSTFVGRCYDCDNMIRGPFVSLHGRKWCYAHFVCSNARCGKSLLDNTLVEFGKRLYCQRDSIHFILNPCEACAGPILSEHYCTGSRSWHPDCLKCIYCGRSPSGRPFYTLNKATICLEDYAGIINRRTLGELEESQSDELSDQ